MSGAHKKDGLRVVPVELADANDFVDRLHRHHRAIHIHRFSLGAIKNGVLVGVAIVGRPAARMTNAYEVLEVTRLCTDGTRNACSLLYGAAARAAKAMGYHRIQTFIMDIEEGASLRAAGWTPDDIESSGGSWSRPSRPRAEDQPTCPKIRYSKEVNPPIGPTELKRFSSACPSCRENGELKLFSDEDIGLAKRNNRKLVCRTCLSRFAPEEL